MPSRIRAISPLSIGAFFSASLFNSLLAQSCTFPSPVQAPSLDEVTYDDGLIPNHPTQWWTSLNFPSGLGVKAADFDQNGYPDLVISGNDGFLTSAKVIYLGYNTDSQKIYVIDDEVLAKSGTQDAYGVDIGDVDGDGDFDIVVGRRFSDVNYQPLYQTGGQRDTVFLNSGTPPVPVPNQQYSIELFPPSSAVKLENLDPVDFKNSQTFGIEIADLDGATGSPPQHHLDIVTTGPYGFRFFSGLGNGQFIHMGTYNEVNPLAQPVEATYRNIAFGDVDGDGDTDMFIPRAPIGAGDAPPDRIWFNRENDSTVPTIVPQFTIGNPLTNSVPAIHRTPLVCWKWQTAAGVSPSASGECTAESAYTMDGDLQDIDGDDDLDLVVASPTCRNALYLNNGTGHFGSNNTSGDGCPAYVFDSPTSSWPSQDPNSYHTSKFSYELFSALGALPANANYLDYEFHVPGKALDFTSSARIRDVNKDGFMDVIFANRNDFEDAADHIAWLEQVAGGPILTGYLDPSLPPPLVFDHIYYGRRPVNGEHVAFCDTVENVGFPCDGTSYVEFIDIGADRRLDWIEANYSNNYHYDLASPPNRTGPLNLPIPGNQGGLIQIFYSTIYYHGSSCAYEGGP